MDLPEELDESGRLAAVFAPERTEALAWLGDDRGVAIAPAAATALADWLVARLAACAHIALDHERRERGETVDAFCAAIRDEWDAFLAAYPVVARLVAQSIVKWRATVHAFLGAIVRDHVLLGATPELLEVRTRAGRLAARRATLIVTLGGGGRWVYRVYDRAMARWFQDVCAALNPALSLPLHVRAIHSRDGYSWDEFVVADGTQSVRHYFVRAGMLVRLAERLAATDFHCENVLAAGEYPVLVDIETLFSVDTTNATPAMDAFLRSPLRAGLLGPANYGDRGRPAVSKAGFHPGGRLVMPLTAARLARMDGPTGGFELVYPVETIAPTMPAPIGDHVDDVLAGYDEMERVLVAHPDLGGLLASAPALPIRSLGAGGRVHDDALHRSLAVELVADESARDAFLAQYSLTPVERAAIRDLELPRPLGTVGPHPATRVLPALTARELDRRRDLIRTAIALGDDRASPSAPRPRDTASFTAQAVAIGDYLLALRFAGGDWHGAVWVPWAGARVFDIVGPDLLSGRAGLALVFAHLSRITGLPRFANAAVAALDGIPADPYAVLGGYVGIGASVYARARCAELLVVPALAVAARADLAAMTAIPDDAPVDLAAGLAGLVLAAALEPARPAWIDQLARGGTSFVLPGGVPAWVPSNEHARAIALARAGVAVAADVPLAWQLRPDPAAITAALATRGELIDDVDLALAGFRTDERFRAALVDCAERLVEQRARTGRWNPATSIAERHDLSALTGLGAVALALLAADAPEVVRSVRRLEY